MIYSVHGYYSKIGSRKHKAKIEAVVFASNKDNAEQLVKSMFDGYPASFESFNVISGQEKDINKIYAQRPELRGIDTETGYIYDEFSHANTIYRYYEKK